MNKSNILLLAAASMMAMSCSDKIDTGSTSDNHAIGSNTHSINLIVSTASPSTRSNVDNLYSEMVEIGGADFELKVSERPLSSLDQQTVTTKGAPVTDSIFKAGKEFVLYMYENNDDAAKDTLVASSDVAYDKSADKWSIEDGINCVWPSNSSGLSRDFWAFQEFDSLGTIQRIKDGTRHYMKFRYKIKDDQDSARLTKDFLVAYDSVKVGTGAEDTIPPVNLHFYHPLTGIQFVIGDLGIDYGLTVTKIELKGLKYKGECKFEKSSKKDSLQFTWTLDDDVTNYVQDYKMQVEKYKYNQNFDLDSITYSKTFFVMPQNILDAAELVVTFKKGASGETQLIKKLNKLGTVNFKPGSLYTYRISGGGEMGMQVFYDTAEKEYILKDTGNVKCYFRAEIVANWYKDTAIVAPWNGQAAFDATLKAYNGTVETDSVWVKGPDGFYYYTQPVEAYHDTKPFIKPESYKGTSSSTVSNQHFRFSVAGQMIRWSPTKDYVTRFWGLTQSEADAIFKH